MGTYTTLYLDEFELASSKGEVIPEVMTVFLESDRRSVWRRLDDGEIVEGPSPEDDFERKVTYATSVANACQRLDVMGFTLDRCKREYEQIRQDELKAYRDAMAEDCAGNGEPDGLYAEQIETYERLTFDNFSTAFSDVFQRRLRSYELTPDQRAELSPTLAYILLEQHDEWFQFGFLCRDIRSFLRAVLSLAPPDMLLYQDVSGLVYGEAIPIRDEAVQLLIERYPANAPRIVLTEGSSDAEILSKSLAVLFPHLVGYYTFFDFHGSKAAGGAPQLISVVKAFAAAGIANRVVAVLDNDTAAHEARRAIREVRLPDNLSVIHCPSRDWLREYPILGPSGDVLLDVNGRAASIELYLGRDVLTEDGRLCPVQWAGYSSTMRAYQGELLEKSAVAERWRAKADRCLADRSAFISADWDDLRAVWEQIMGAFPD